MTDLPTLTALLARVEAATEMTWQLFTDASFAVGANHDVLYDRLWHFVDAEAWETAALALIERRLPGWQWGIDSPYAPNHKLAHAELWTGDDEVIADAQTPTLALIAALLKAEIARAEATQEERE
jgi:hypothetical protein